MCGSGQSKVKTKNTEKGQDYVAKTISKDNTEQTPLSTPQKSPPKLGKIEKNQSLSNLQKNASVPYLNEESAEKVRSEFTKRQPSRIQKSQPRRRESDEMGEGTGAVYEQFKNEIGVFPYNQSELSVESKFLSFSYSFRYCCGNS